VYCRPFITNPLHPFREKLGSDAPTYRYGRTGRSNTDSQDDTTEEWRQSACHPLLATVSPVQASQDVLCQTTKLVTALTSGEYARPTSNNDKDDSYQDDNNLDEEDPRYRLAPRMFKHLVGKDHVDFRTHQQQDSAQFLQYYLDVLQRAELGGQGKLHRSPDLPFYTTNHLFQFQTVTRLLCTADQKVKYKVNPAETIWTLPIPMDRAVVRDDEPDAKRLKQQDEQSSTNASPSTASTVSGSTDDTAMDKKAIPTITLKACMDSWASEHVVDGMHICSGQFMLR
jgi:hypothetical protein